MNGQTRAMTRINCVPVEELCDEHLRAEYRELVRVPKLAARLSSLPQDLPEQYTVRTEDKPEGGKGHVRFFFNKMIWLRKRHAQLEAEMVRRGFKTNMSWPQELVLPQDSLNDWNPDGRAMSMNRKRIQERMPANPHYNRQRKMNHE